MPKDNKNNPVKIYKIAAQILVILMNNKFSFFYWQNNRNRCIIKTENRKGDPLND